MKTILNWFKKSEALGDVDRPRPALHCTPNEALQGSYTDHYQNAYEVRQQISPMLPDELEAFYSVLEKLNTENPEEMDFRHILEIGFAEGWFTVGKDGELRVSKEAP